jgi:heat shock protein HslJ
MGIGLKHVVIVLVLAATALAACGPVSPSGGQETVYVEPPAGAAVGLEGVTWTLVSYANSTGQTVDLLPGSEITAQFQAGEVNGNAGCNSYFGSYQARGSRLTVGPLGHTEMYCMPDELMAQETDYLATWQSAASFEIVGDQLRILGESAEPMLIFAPLGSVPLTSTLWQLTGYNNGKGGFASVLADTEITAIFGEDGRLIGSSGCNTYSTTYETDGDQLTVGPVASTMMTCGAPQGIMEQASAYVNTLASATTYGIEGKELTIWNAEGQRALTYRTKD